MCAWEQLASYMCVVVCNKDQVQMFTVNLLDLHRKLKFRDRKTVQALIYAKKLERARQYIYVCTLYIKVYCLA